ncbi:hypothetical protein RhiirA5_441040 [Rhizophagus irregularis]|uniref:Uncharacterized protein n=1 Tax=Rhizophagus irregularis TaxID=588596 RepID=A0A2I1FC07_9GLOM|nr:hypothetical protein RhiirA5_441040 [Rhizophagus irregularis]PKC55556.1 hypothetical protein RhiirA1_475403 [Rhizophagus irregularis]PKY31893.1 hypothetical protein RhiirB3_449728 [Rhizophagus irregularis]
MSCYISSFIILIKKKLGFSRHAVGKKCFSIETFPENIFVYLFKDEENFKYSSAKHKYQCYFRGLAGETRLKQIFQYDQWNFRQNPLTNTKGYVLLEDYKNTYQIKFMWNQTVLSENNREFMLGKMICNFITDSGEFQEKQVIRSTFCDLNQISTSNPKIPIFQRDSLLPNHLKQPIKRKFCYILPRPLLKDINQSRLPSQS